MILNDANAATIGDDCPTCRSRNTQVVLELEAMPVHVGRLWPTVEAARACPRGDIYLGYCRRCGMIWNRRFDPELIVYDGDYDNSLFFSPLHRQHARRSAERLIQRYAVRNRDIIEIGSGTGEFLTLLCQLGNNRGVGFDPSYRPEGTPPEGITFVRELFDEHQADRRADLVCSRYLLEHVGDPVAFLKQLHRTLRGRTESVIYFEVPNASLILDEGSVWDVIYEHFAHFGHMSLARTFEEAGFGVCDVGDGYEGQAVWVEARPADHADVRPASTWDDRPVLEPRVKSLSEDFCRTIDQWQRRLAQFHGRGQTVVAWGAGAKGISFLNMLNVHEQIRYIVDINPRKEGHFISCTGQQIVGPAALKSVCPEVVLVMNPMYESEIRQMIQQQGTSAEIVCV